MDVALVKMPYTGSRNVPELSCGPDHVESGDLVRLIGDCGATVQSVSTVKLSPEQDSREYGEWHRMGLACGHLARLVAGHVRAGRFVVGLLGNCTALLGMLAGLQRSGGAAAAPRRVGMLFVDAHPDFNTPETTLSGMLGGMPVAVAAGLCLTRLRREAGLDPALATSSVVMAGLRDVDEKERELLEASRIETLSVEDLQTRSPRMHEQLDRLASTSDAVYVHVDMDVLDAAEVGGHPFAVPGGPSSDELAAALEIACGAAPTAALGIASTPPAGRDGDGSARRAAHRLILAAVRSAGHRGPSL